MKMAFTYLACLLILASGLKALTVRSVAHNDWSNPSTWSTGQVPASPDTIYVDHYVTLTANVTINAPTILFIDASGTVCGDYVMDVACGAKWYNYGSVYLNTLYVRDGWNYCTLTFRNYAAVSACTLNGYGAGFSNVPPKGNMNISNFSSCRSFGTPGECTVGIKEYEASEKIIVYPNPTEDKILIKQENGEMYTVSLSDAAGRIVKAPEKNNEISLAGLDAGIYLMNLSLNGKTYRKRIIKNE